LIQKNSIESGKNKNPTAFKLKKPSVKIGKKSEITDSPHERIK
jgi:hypothetical protein